MKKKGFTLIELLAVIIVLAIIALIATPTILNVVENSRKKAFEQTAIGYYNAARYVYDEMMLTRDRQDVYFTFNNGEQVSSNETYQLKVKGDKPKGGLVYLTGEGSISVSIHNNKYCAIVEDDQKVRLSENIEECMGVPESCYLMNAGSISYDKANETCPKTIGLLIIPSEVNGEKVEKIATNGFNDLSIKKVRMLADITSIGNYAFRNNQITSVEIPEGVTTIGISAFENNQLTSINIPSSVTSIGQQAFNNNQLLDDQAFIYKRKNDGTEDRTTIVGYGGAKRDNVVIPEGVTTIGVSAFSDNKLTSVNIPSSVTSIGQQAFNNNQLPDDQAFIYKRNSDGTEDKTTIVSYGGAKRDNLVIPEHITIIKNNAFSGNQLTGEITISENIKEIWPGAFKDNSLKKIIYRANLSKELSITFLLFKNNPIEEVIIGENLTTIPKYLFYNQSIGKVTIPESVTEIRYAAFRNSNLAEIIIPNSVTSIEMFAFYDNQLKEVTIPSSVTTIRGNAFKNNLFENASAITIEGDANRFDSNWETIGFPAK